MCVSFQSRFISRFSIEKQHWLSVITRFASSSGFATTTQLRESCVLLWFWCYLIQHSSQHALHHCHAIDWFFSSDFDNHSNASETIILFSGAAHVHHHRRSSRRSLAALLPFACSRTPERQRKFHFLVCNRIRPTISRSRSPTMAWHDFYFSSISSHSS